MTQPQQTLQRLPKIKAGLLEGKQIDEIAVLCKVTEKTVDRDLQKFRASPLFEEWLREEWQRVHYIIIKEHPVEAYRQLTRLLGQTFTRRIEAKTETTTELKQEVTFKFDELNEDERELCRKIARRYIKRNNKTGPTAIH